MSNQEQQEEEREVLLSIYEGDSNFFDISPTVYQYKIGEDGASKSALLELSWGDNYPEEIPTINLDVFYNKHLLAEVKKTIKDALTAEAEALLGCGSTYTLFEYAKENIDTLLAEQTEIAVHKEQEEKREAATAADVESKKPKQKKEQLSKNQKRRMYDKFGTQGMMEGKQRGWNWVDLIKHLSQTGTKAEGQ